MFSVVSTVDLAKSVCPTVCICSTNPSIFKMFKKYVFFSPRSYSFVGTPDIRPL